LEISRIRYYLGLILILLGTSFIAPAIVSFIYMEDFTIDYLFTAFIIVLLGFLLWRNSVREEISYADSLYIAVISFLLPALANTFVMILNGFDPWDSLFESISGITTTGLSMFTTEELPKTIIFVRAWLQWIGGIGIVIMTIGFLLKPGTVAYQLFATHLRKEAYMPSVKIIARAVLGLYGMLTLMAFITYKISGLDFYQAIVYALTTTSTGGFSATNVFPKAIIWPAIIFMFLSAQSFTRYYLIIRFRKPINLLKSVQIRSFIVLYILGFILFYLALSWAGMNVSYTDSLFNTLSALSTTGYATIDMTSLPDSGKYILILLMLIGAGMGSTGGGIKQYRLIILFKELHRRLKKVYSPPEQVEVVKIEDKPISDEEIYGHLLVINLYIITLIITLIIFLLSGYELMDSLFNISSALGTVGLQTSMLNNTIEWYLKLIISIDMFLGRLEVVTVLATISHMIDKLRG